MNPIPHINQVFSLVVQEEQQRRSNKSHTPTSTIAYTVHTGFPRRNNTSDVTRTSTVGTHRNQQYDRPFCTLQNCRTQC